MCNMCEVPALWHVLSLNPKLSVLSLEARLYSGQKEEVHLFLFEYFRAEGRIEVHSTSSWVGISSTIVTRY